MSDQTVCTRVRRLVESPLAEIDIELVDVEFNAGSLRVTVDHIEHPGASGGIDLDGIDAASRLVSRMLDDADPIPTRYSLEVSSPGI
ncbi:MAG: ribosome maturation factor RimP, partial [Pseudonocardiaceae bacterium]